MGTTQATCTITVLVVKKTALTPQQRNALTAIIGPRFTEVLIQEEPATDEAWAALCDSYGDSTNVIVVTPLKNRKPPAQATTALDIADFNHIFFDSSGSPRRVVSMDGEHEPYKGLR